MHDANNFYRNTTDSLTATETSAWLATYGSPAIGLRVFIEIPKQSVGDTLQATLQFSTDGTTLETASSLEIGILSSTTAAITTPVTRVRGVTGMRFKYSRLVLTALGTSPDFGAVRAGVADPRAEPNLLGVGAFAGNNPQL